MTFALILSLFGTDSREIPDYQYAIATDISAIECAREAELQETLAARMFVAGDYTLTCVGTDNYED